MQLSTRPCSETRIGSRAAEPTIREMLADPVVQAVMAADGVDATLLGIELRAIAERLPRGD